MSFDRRPPHSIGSSNAVATTASNVNPGSQDSLPTTIPSQPHSRHWATQIPEGYVVPVCGGVAGAVSGLVSCPLDVIKTKLQAQGGFQIPKDTIQFPLYEVFKEKFTGIGAGMTETEEDRSHHFYGLALAVFLSKVCASTATYPHEVVRTRLQTQQRSSTAASFDTISSRKPQENHSRPPGSTGSSKALNSLPYRGTIQTCKTILLEEGWRGFYAGLGTNLIRAVPSAMTTILTFEYLKKSINSLRRQEQDRIDAAGQPAT
ncbi:MAG: hypothetical protein Q9228_000728 [Teloschistes exilis]